MRTELIIAFAGTVGFSGATQALQLSEHVTIAPPPGAEAPAPAAVFISGCGGVRQVQSDYTKAAHDAGWAAVVVDSHAARDLSGLTARALVCTGARLWGQERAQDVFEGLDLVRADERIDASAMVLVGWSHGGWTVLDSMAAAEADEAGDAPFAGVVGAFLLYPYCGFPVRSREDPVGDPFPVQAVLGGRDLVADPEDCEALFNAQNAQGARIETLFEPELTHAFDAADQPWDPRMEYDADGAARAHAAFGAFLKQVRKPEQDASGDTP